MQLQQNIEVGKLTNVFQHLPDTTAASWEEVSLQNILIHRCPLQASLRFAEFSLRLH